VGRVGDPRSRERAAFDHVTEGRLHWQALPGVYDRVRIGDLHFDFVAGAKRFRDDLRSRFPAERSAIDGYLAAVRAVARARFPDRATAEIVVPAPFAWFEPWANTRWKHRNAGYDAFKARLTERLLREFAAHAPEASGRIAYAELSTPLTTRHFANAARGAIYGASATPARFVSRAMGPRTPIPGSISPAPTPAPKVSPARSSAASWPYRPCSGAICSVRSSDQRPTAGATARPRRPKRRRPR
jgi:hypothetical protein